MIENLEQKKILIVVVLLTVLGLGAIGYFFANKKSEPVYISKIDRIMFDTQNQSPKYIITLPDRTKAKPKQEQESFSLDENTQQEAAQPKEPEPQGLDAVMAQIPSLGKLGAATGQMPLPNTERRSDLLEETGGMKLPKPNGNEKPWAAYGRKINVNPRFRRIAVIVKNLGLNQANAGLISKALPSEVSLSFSPYALEAAKQIKDARLAGHETYVDMLLSSKDFLKSDTGPMAMSLTASVEQNMQRLNQTLAVEAPVGGVIITPGVTDESIRDQMEKLLQNIQARGLLMVDATGENGIDGVQVSHLDRAKADFVLEENFSRQNIRQLLAQAEATALQNGQAIIVTEGKPVVIEELAAWFKSFSPQLSYEEMKAQNLTEIEKPFALVPISNLVVE